MKNLIEKTNFIRNMVVFIVCVCSILYFIKYFIFVLDGSYNVCDKLKECNSGKVCVYFINLDKSVDRLNYILPQVKLLGYNFERIPGIYGKNLDPKYVAKILDEESYINFFKSPPTLGTVGCALSHEKAWRTFINSDNEFAIIFEDDIKFDHIKLKKVVDALIKNKEAWDLVSFELNHNGHPVKMLDLEGVDEKLSIYLTSVRHTGAYLINRTTAYKLISKFYPIKMPNDHYFVRTWELGIKFFGIEPRIVHQKFGDSEINAIPKKKHDKNIRVVLSNALYICGTGIMNFISSIVELIKFKIQ